MQIPSTSYFVAFSLIAAILFLFFTFNILLRCKKCKKFKVKRKYYLGSFAFEFAFLNLNMLLFCVLVICNSKTRAFYWSAGKKKGI